MLVGTILLFFFNPMIISATELGVLNSSDYFKTVIYVIFVLIIIIGLIIVLIKFLASKSFSMSANRSIKQLSAISLGQNKSIQVVEIGHNLYVVGVGENVELIEKIDQQDEIGFIKDSLHADYQSKPIAWITRISKSFQQNKNNTVQSETDQDTAVSFQEVFNSRMKQVSIRKQRIEEMLSEENNKNRLNNR